MPLKLNAAAGGSVTLDPPSTASNFTATFPANTGTVITTASTGAVTQAMLGAGVAGNGPAFSAYISGSQSIPNNVNTKITFNLELFDTNNNFDPTTNYRFTPTVAGYYQINLTTYISDIVSAGTGVVNSALHKNGTIYAYGAYKLIGNFAEISTSSWLVFMNGSTDYLEAYFLQSNGGARTMAGGVAGTIFSGSLLRSA